MSSETERSIGYHLEAFRPYIVEHFDAMQLSIYYTLIDRGKQREIAALHKKDPVEAAYKFLQYVDELDEPGKYTELKNAFMEAEYPKVCEILSGEKIPDDTNQQKVIHCMKQCLKNKVRPVEILCHLESKGIFDQADCQRIRREDQNEGAIYSACLMFELLPARSRNWFSGFLEVLLDNEMEDIATQIEPDRVEKIKMQREAGDIGDLSGLSLDSYGQQSGGPSYNDDDDDDDDDDDVTRQKTLFKHVTWQKTLFKDETDDSVGSSSVRENVMYVKENPSLNDLDCPPSKVTKTTDIKMVTNTEEMTPELSQLHNLKAVTVDQDVFDEKVALQEQFANILATVNNDGTESVDSNSATDSTDLKATCIYKRQGDIPQEESSGNDSDSDNNADLQDKDVVLREFQKELAGPALAGKNAMVVSAPNTGKTIIGIKVIQEHLAQAGNRKRKAILLVNQVNLANQHGKSCREYLGKYKPKVISGETEKLTPMKHYLPLRDVFVVTAQVFLNALRGKEIESITEFSLIIFDECHHCHSNHAYNSIMEIYREMKHTGNIDSSMLPQILGLTASPGTDKANTVEKAEEHIKHLMANLDTPYLCTVQKHKDSLREFEGKPETDICIAKKRSGENDKYGKVVRSLMQKIEEWIAKKVEGVKEPPSACSKRGSEQYIQYLSDLRKYTDSLHNENIRRFLNPCISHLEYYNISLLLYDDARVDDAVDYLKEEMTIIGLNPNKTENEKLLFQCYQKVIGVRYENSTNPKLEMLKEIILRHCTGSDSSRGIVFVKRRILAASLTEWMKTVNVFDPLKPALFVGQATSSERGGMTRSSQDSILQGFREGEHRVLVSTSIAEEGLHISECKFVIRYEHVTNEIAMIQSRGRGRAEDSHYYVLTSEVMGTAEKERLNRIREDLMKQAIQRVQIKQSKNPDAFSKEIDKLQREIQLRKQMKACQRLESLQSATNFQLVCRNCSNFLCMASDMRKVQGSHHVVIDTEFPNRVIYLDTEALSLKGIQMFGKTLCKECNSDLGTRCNYKSVELPVLTANKILKIDNHGGRKPMKKWKNAGFEIPEITMEEILAILSEVE